MYKRMHNRYAAFLLAAALLAPPAQVLAEADDDLQVLGWIETVEIGERGFGLDAKLDTGADNSSLHAIDIELFERNDIDWVRFTVELDDGQRGEFEYPQERTARIRRAAGGTDDRPVIKLGICIGTIHREVEVNLTDRSDLSYPMLIGRSFLREYILVDSGPKYTRDPECDVDDGNWADHE